MPTLFGSQRRASFRETGERPVVALLEARMSRELSRLVEKHGGSPLCVPALREVPGSPEATRRVIESLVEGRHHAVIFMTGIAASLLFEVAEQQGLRHQLVRALAGVITVARGPKPSAALRGFGVPATITARAPFTSAQLIDALGGLPLEGRPVLLFHHGEPSAALAQTLRARQVALSECFLYRWLLPQDCRGLAALIGGIIAGEVDALVVTCQVQFRHLCEVARSLSLEAALADALRRGVVVAAMGPTCEVALRAHAVPVHVMPEVPKMGPLIRSLMLRLMQPSAQPGASPRPAMLS